MFRYVSTQWDSIKAEEVKLCEEGIKRYSGYPRTAILKNRLAQLEQPTLSASTNNTVYPGQQLGIKLEYKNVQKVIVQIYRSSKTPLQAAAHTSAKKIKWQHLGTTRKREDILFATAQHLFAARYDLTYIYGSTGIV